MVTRRTALAITVGLTTLAASGLALQAGRQGSAAAPPAVERGGAHLLSGTASPPGTQPAAAPSPASRPSGAERLEAVRTVKLFCDLVERGWLWRAGGLCSTPTVWRRSEFRTLRKYTFLSARIVAAADPGALAVLVRIHVHVPRGTTPQETFLRQGVNTLRFTLERVGTTTGGWLISAITTSLQTQERGPS